MSKFSQNCLSYQDNLHSLHKPHLQMGPDQVFMRCLNTSRSLSSLNPLGKSLFQSVAPEYLRELSPKVVVFDFGCTNFEESLKLYAKSLLTNKS